MTTAAILLLLALVAPAQAQTSTQHGTATTQIPMTITGFHGDAMGPSATQTLDPWQCYTKDLSSFFKVPQPPASLDSAMIEYGERNLFSTCGSKRCGWPSNEGWCGFTKSAAPSLLPAWSTYASSCSSFWSANWRGVVETASACPNQWWDYSLPGGLANLNFTIAWADCYDRAHPQKVDAISTASTLSLVFTVETASSTSATSGSAATASSRSSSASQSTQAPTSTSGSGRLVGVADMGIVAVAGLGAAALRSWTL